MSPSPLALGPVEHCKTLQRLRCVLCAGAVMRHDINGSDDGNLHPERAMLPLSLTVSTRQTSLPWPHGAAQTLALRPFHALGTFFPACPAYLHRPMHPGSPAARLFLAGQPHRQPLES